MAKQSFLLVSLQEDKAKELANVISNDSCRKILDFLGGKEDATESEIAKALSLPISTVHYNLQHLMKAGIISVDEFHYSEKGKEVNHYKLANKYIIIAPKSTYGIKEKLKSILPVSILALIGAGFIQLYTIYFRQPVFGAMQAEAPVMEAARDSAAKAAAPMMQAAGQEAATAVMEKAPEVAVQTVQSEPNLALWFLFGCIFVIILVVIFEMIRSRNK
jgi:DNA-binding transcriptional ArsR family regulator